MILIDVSFLLQVSCHNGWDFITQRTKEGSQYCSFFSCSLSILLLAHLKWHLCIKYYSFQSFYSLLYIYFFSNIQGRKKTSFWDSIHIFFFYIKEQINLQYQSCGTSNWNLTQPPATSNNSYTLLWSPFMYITIKCMCS